VSAGTAAPALWPGLAALAGWRLAAALGLCGLLAAAGHAPLGWALAAVAGLAGVIALAALAPSPGAAARRGWLAGTAYFAGSLFWIVEPFFIDAARDGWMAPFALVFVATGFALFWGAAAALGHRAGRGPRSRAVAVALALVLAGFGRTYLLTGFPWALPAYVWTGSDVIQWVAWVGPHGLGLLTLLAAAAPLALARPGARWAGAAAALALVALLWAAGAWRAAAPLPAPRSDRMVRLVQPNAEQRLKWHPDHVHEFFRRQLELTAAPAAGPLALVVWPETAVPYLLENAAGALEAMRAAAGPAQLVFGIQRYQDDEAFNSLAVMGPDGAVTAVYDKHHLVPFGEYFPGGAWSRRLGLAGLAQQLAGGGYAAGPGPSLLEVPGVGRVLPLICYEAIFPQDIFRAPGRPDLMIQITNDGWFGRISGPYQHLAQARVRAIEQGVPMLRAANTGISAVIDARGRVLASLPLGAVGHLDAALPQPLPPTPYSRTRDVPAFLLVLCALGAMVPRRRAKSAIDPDSPPR
jgi:apolipoprotein N-acyltransferase